MFRDFCISFQVKNAYTVNQFIYCLQRLPLIGKFIPSTFYKIKLFKLLSFLITFIREVIKVFGYKLLYIAVLIFAPVLALDMVWTIADILNAFMAVPNLIAVLLLSSKIAEDTKFYIDNIDHHHKEEVPVLDK